MMINTYQLKSNPFPCVFICWTSTYKAILWQELDILLLESTGQGDIIHSFIVSIVFVPRFCLGIVYKHSLGTKEFINN